MRQIGPSGHFFAGPRPATTAMTQEMPIIQGDFEFPLCRVGAQPLGAQVTRIIAALECARCLPRAPPPDACCLAESGGRTRPCPASLIGGPDRRRYLGQPFADDVKEDIAAAIADEDEAATAEALQKILDPHCLTMVQINPESRVKVGFEMPAPQVRNRRGSRPRGRCLCIEVVGERAAGAPR
jgi:hypothetical protein